MKLYDDLKWYLEPKRKYGIRDLLIGLTFVSLSLFSLYNIYKDGHKDQREQFRYQKRECVLESAYKDEKDLVKALVSLSAKEHDIDENFLLAVAKVESDFNPRAVSKKGAIGVMQIMPSTAKEYCRLNRDELFDPEKNADCGAKIIKHLMEEFDNDYEKVLSAYNHGKNGTKNKIKNGTLIVENLPCETQRYIKYVMTRTF
ncbi:MAG: lytic transglycosylase domain-containing protein [Candidatus Aenigmatarchaeota archaeon]